MLLPDITQYYSNESNEPLRYGYKRKKVDRVIECRTCKTILTSDDFVIDRMFCCVECEIEFFKEDEE